MAFTTAIPHLGEPFFDKLITARDEIDDPRFDRASAAALGAVKDESMLDTVHDYVLSDNIGARESFSMIEAMLNEKSLKTQH